MCRRVLSLGTFIGWLSGERNGEEARGVEGSGIGHSVGRDVEANVDELVEVEGEKLGGQSGIGGSWGVRWSTLVLA